MTGSSYPISRQCLTHHLDGVIIPKTQSTAKVPSMPPDVSASRVCNCRLSVSCSQSVSLCRRFPILDLLLQKARWTRGQRGRSNCLSKNELHLRVKAPFQRVAFIETSLGTSGFRPHTKCKSFRQRDRAIVTLYSICSRRSPCRVASCAGNRSHHRAARAFGRDESSPGHRRRRTLAGLGQVNPCSIRR